MKLASLKGGRDGRLVVVSDDLAWFAGAAHIATTLQAALDEWDRCEGALRNLATDLEHGVIPKDRFHEREAAAPLPRIYRRVDSPALALPARDPIVVDGKCGFSAGVVVVTGDVQAGASAEEGAAHIRLIGLVSDISLAGFDSAFQSNPASAYSPVLVTPDALGPCWDGRRLSGPLRAELNGSGVGSPAASADFGAVIADAARTRALGPGSVVGAVNDTVHALKQGDLVRIWMEDDRRHSIFGAIEQSVA